MTEVLKFYANGEIKESFIFRVGQVWAKKEYFKIISDITNDFITYLFYNRSEYYYMPNRRRIPVDVDFIKNLGISTIEDTVTIHDFTTEVKLKKLNLLDEYFGKLPILGMPAHRNSLK